ncbi:MAG: T9SS type A sorting domain-containing protein [Rhodothermales bacterium]
MRFANYISFVVIILAAFLAPALSHAQTQPVISNIQITPSNPTHEQSVAVTAEVRADSAIASVVIFNLNIGSNITMQSTGGASYEATIQGRPAGTAVNFRIRATDVADNISESDQQSYTVSLNAPVLSQPTINEAGDAITLNWTSVPGASSYIIYRSLEPESDLPIATVSGNTTTYEDDRIGNARELYYVVSAVGGGMEKRSNEQSYFSQVISNAEPFSIVGSTFDILLTAPSTTDLTYPELRINLNDLFRDVDPEDVLTYEISLFDIILRDLLPSEIESIIVITFPDILGPELLGTTVSFIVQASDGVEGNRPAEIQIKARFNAKPQFAFEGDEPRFAENPVKDQPFRVFVDVEDNNLESVDITFRRSGDGVDSLSAKMTTMDSVRFEYTIPAFAVTERGIEYTMVAHDQDGFSTIAPNKSTDNKSAFSLEVSVPGEGIRSENPQPAASSTPNAYRLFSIPIQADATSPAVVLEDDLGSYKKSKWRFFEAVDNVIPELLPEFPNTKPLAPGAAFWLIVKDENKLIDSGPGKSVSTDQPFEIELEPGWNFIGNPFSFDIPVPQLVLDDGSAVDILFFNGSVWTELGENASIKPFEGYAVNNNTASAKTLRIYPSTELLLLLELDVDTRGFSDEMISPAKNDNGEINNGEINNSAIWSMHIIATAGGFSDTNQIVLHQNSETGWDPMDKPEPPFIGDYVSVYFPHNDWQQPLSTYRTDARPMPGEGDTWSFEVASTFDHIVDLTFEGIDSLPEGLEAVLFDEQLVSTQNLTENNTYQVNSSATHPQKLKIVIGTSAFADQQKETFTIAEDGFTLSPSFPNPFSQTTTVSFSLAETCHVTLEVFNILGEKVTTLIAGSTLQQGINRVIWDGLNEAGHPLANGVYFVRLTAGTFVDSHKVIVLR